MFWFLQDQNQEIDEIVSKDNFENENFPWLTSQIVNIGNYPVLAMRVNFVGELGWELHHPIEYQNQIFDIYSNMVQNLT